MTLSADYAMTVPGPWSADKGTQENDMIMEQINNLNRLKEPRWPDSAKRLDMTRGKLRFQVALKIRDYSTLQY